VSITESQGHGPGAGEDGTYAARSPQETAQAVRPQDKAVRQEEIIAAAMTLIGKYGVQGTTVSRIAQAAGIARGALYQHFPNREAVLEAALDACGSSPRPG